MNALIVILLALIGNGCIRHSSYLKIPAARVGSTSPTQPIPKITLTAEARQRLGIISENFPKDRKGKTTIPLSSLIYDTHGIAWVFVETAPLEFLREPIQVLDTHGNQIQIQSSLNDSSRIVIQGAAELMGTESGVGK